MKKMKHKQLITCPKKDRHYEGKGALFLDRDGVVIKDKHYLSRPDDVELHAGAKDLIRNCKERGHGVFIVTNQSGIGRGLFSWEDYIQVTKRMLELLGPDGIPTAIYANGFIPSQSEEEWRKPNPGMLLEAKNDYGINLTNSVMVGDRISDLRAGIRAGLRQVIHVLTGHGKTERKIAKHLKPGSMEEYVIKFVDNIKCIEQIIDFDSLIVRTTGFQGME